jgi:hypothetical protein
MRARVKKWLLLALVCGAGACDRAPPPEATPPPPASAPGTDASVPPLASRVPSHGPSAPTAPGCGPLPPGATTPCAGDIYSCPRWTCVNGKWIDNRPRKDRLQ